ncbi:MULTISPECIES: aromatic amino acid lyase [Henriciella]|jgi:histidine ammonia-lyase|uniref:Histidine ammonia-lyase n=1 Tax=Henriciella pelagia TaxID=1977912 RepID=A0ABQ1JNC1_9PROT|nr:aromatic amino acid lyase [Henriciella pelagia]GGB72711.1 histidine ammonia-lyase [Henriciella pelagia]
MQRSSETETLRTFLQACAARELPAGLNAAETRVAADYSKVERLREASPGLRIYGLTTLPGHRDDEAPDDDYSARYQNTLIESHCVPVNNWFSGDVGVCVTLAKAYAVAAGASLVSPDLYGHILSATADRGFAPAIARNASYSSGDVIPAAHWARELLGRSPGYTLKPGEGMALINGAFVHVGVTAWAMSQANLAWKQLLANTKAFLERVPGGGRDEWSRRPEQRSLSREALGFVYENARPAAGDMRQPPVSVRAIDQVIDGTAMALSNLAVELDRALLLPSGNPQLTETAAGEPTIVPSGSFALPGLAIAADAMTSSLLMIAWHVTRRLEFFLSGDVDGVAQDAATHDNPLGFIQWPKLAVAKLENMRMRFAGKAFLSGGATSYGVEDFWTQGVSVSDQLACACEALSEILVLERAVLESHADPDKADIAEAVRQLEDASNNVPASLAFE